MRLRIKQNAYHFYIVLTTLLFIGCESPHRFKITEVGNPSASNSGEVSIVVSPDEQLYLSWIEERDSLESALHISTLDNDIFQESDQIISGHDWFINWADFPAIAFIGQTPSLFAHWLKMSDSGTYDYDIHYAIKANDESDWQEHGALHNDGVAAEHGFVSSCTVDESLLAVWLDGRQTKSEIDAAATASPVHNHGHGGDMSLRSALIDQQGHVTERLEIDAKVCDCCQTDVVLSDCGPIAVYRDKSDAGIRDIFYSHLDNGTWSAPQPVHRDGWKIEGCPVNGPRIASSAGLLAVAWYTESGGFRKTLLSTSTDCGQTFRKPVILSHDSVAMGRVDIQISQDQHIFISYMEEDVGNANIWIAKCDAEGTLLYKAIVGRNKKSRKSGFPRMAIYGNKVYLAYRDLVKSNRIKVLKIS